MVCFYVFVSFVWHFFRITKISKTESYEKHLINNNNCSLTLSFSRIRDYPFGYCCSKIITFRITNWAFVEIVCQFTPLYWVLIFRLLLSSFFGRWMQLSALNIQLSEPLRASLCQFQSEMGVDLNTNKIFNSYSSLIIEILFRS